MKKVLIISVLALAACISANAQVLVGVGYERTGSITKVGNTIIKGGPGNGVFVSGIYNYDFDSNFSLEGGLTAEFFNSKEEVAVATASFHEIELSLPIFVDYKFNFDDNFNLGIFAGPQFSCSLLSNMKQTVGSTTTKVNLLDDEAGRNFNIYATAGIFFDFAQNYRIRFEAFQSLLDYDKTDASSISYRGIAIGLSYKF